MPFLTVAATSSSRCRRACESAVAISLVLLPCCRGSTLWRTVTCAVGGAAAGAAAPVAMAMGA